uniref:Vacuolar protein sorting 13 homolog A n=1 Tax=Mastacembelus armatus TaxID=205130 RepID=A0A7N8X286_9TELE
MVFESLVVDVLNRFLGDYVVNLDSSQLKLGIWGGDAVLTNLEIKENALSQLDIPFKVRAGHIGETVVTIPWKNLYTQSVEATLDGVYLLIVPTASIKYDAEKEEKQLQEARQRELQRIEETKLKAAEQENPTLEKQDTFVEKLVTQVIKNLQVKISNIHVRYEDDVSTQTDMDLNLRNCFMLSAQFCHHGEKLHNSHCFVSFCFQLVRLDSLFAYWNVNSALFSNHSADEALVSHPLITEPFFRPISADAKLRMNPRSDVDFSSPKVDLMVNLSEVAIELNRPQYISILELLGSVDMMSRNLPYRKFRPRVSVQENPRIWWKYIITSILEVDVKPRLHMWSWKHIRQHRWMVKCYRELYKTKITSKKPSEDLLKQLEGPEKTLDIFNITLARQQAEVEVSKAGLRIYRPGLKMEEEESQGWFSWMWNWGGEATPNKEVKTGAFDELLTPAEKAKLYTAIGYSETAANPNLPKNFEDMKVNFHMERLSVSIKDKRDKNEIIKLTVGELKSTLTQRPGAQAIKFLSLFEVTGLASNMPAPSLLSSRKAATGAGTPLLCVLFETNPLDESANQRLHVESQPLEIIYDAATVNSMSAFFMPPDDLQLDELTNATLMKLEQFRDRTATGLMYVIETQKVLDLKVNLMASYVIIPQTGFYNGTQNIVLLDLGHFKMSSQSRKHLPQLSASSSNIEAIMSRAYDSFDIQLSNLQFLYSKPDGDWKKARKQKQSPLHILEPVDLKVEFSRAMVVTDSRMAKYKMSGELPLLSLRISDNKLRSVLELIESIPLPESKPAARSNTTPKFSVQLCRLSQGKEVTVLHLDIEGLGTELKLRTFDMTSNTYLREICLKCPEYMDSEDKQVQLITTLDNTEVDLLTLEYIKADKNGPEFKSQHNNTEQLIKVTFSSLDVHLHTEALLNTMNFLNNLLPPSTKKEGGQEELPTIPEEDEAERSKFSDVVNLHIRADLRSLKVFIRGQKAHVSEISIEGLVSEVLMRKKEMEVLANLKNIVILDCDKDALYKKAVSIADKEVFAFRMVNYTDATEGDAYLDMSEVDTSVMLTVGCIQVVFLNKFVSSILAFINNFQEAKEALAEVTVQAAEKAASGVKELAERSTRIALNVHFNAPVIFLPQSSSSSNVIVADLGLLSVKNRFAKQPFKSDAKIPPVVDIMTVKLTDLKMYRTSYINGGFQGEIELLKPVSLDLEIQRNLSSNWYHSIPDIGITAHLKPMSVSITSSTTEPSSDSHLKPNFIVGNTVVTAAVVETQKSIKLKTTLKLDFKFDSMTVVLYIQNYPSHICFTKPMFLKLLAEFTLGTISTSVQMFSDNSMKASVRLAACLLDDKRPRIKMVTPRMMAMRPGAEQNTMVEVNYRQGRDGTILDTVVQDVYLCASMEFLLTVADIFLKAMQGGFAQVPQSKSTVAPPVVSKTEMNVVVRNPEVVFVADLTRADAPALVMTTQCELVMKSGAEGSQMTAVINDLKVLACPFLREKRKNNVTTVLQPCQVFFQSTQAQNSPQAMEVSINTLTLKVSPIIINTVITIQSALTPTAETPEELESPVPVDLWEKRYWKDLKFWFLEEEGDEDTRSLTPLIPQGESLQVSIKSICLTLEAGVGHRTVPMLLAKSSFQGDVTNWSTLINLHSALNLEVHYYNEVMGVWEPLLEPLEDNTGDGFRPWKLELKMKKKQRKYSLVADEVDYLIPEYITVINISSKDQLNITLSKCGLAMLSNLGTAFAEATKQTAECFQKDEAPFVLKNRLGLPVSVRHSEMFCPIGQQSSNRTVKLQDGETLRMDYSTTDSDQFSAMTSLSGKDYYIQPTPAGHTPASVIPLIKVGRGMYSVMHKDSGVTRFLVCQISSVEGSKYIKIRSPFQIINHFSIPFKVFEGSTYLGTALPSEEFCVPLDSYRSELTLQPITEVDAEHQGEQFECSQGFSYEDVSNHQPETHLQQTCRCRGDQGGVMMINIVPVKDAVTFKHTGDVGENFDVPFVLHLWPSILLRNLLPYPITYKLKDGGVCAPEASLNPGHSAQLHTAVIDQSSLSLRLLNYLAQDWSSEYRSDFRKRTELDIAVHVKYDQGQTVIAIHSPYWMVNKTGRMLQYKADDIHRKHPLDYDMPLLFSFKPRHFLRNNKVRLMISDSELSDDFSLDTVGSYGDVKCKGRYKDYLVGVKIDASSFSLTRVVTFVPFYMLVNRTKQSVFICEVGQENWTEAKPEQSAIPFWPENDTKQLKIKVQGSLSPPQTIDFTRPENCLLLRLDNSVGGITVDVNLSEHSATIKFSEYHDGAAPFLIINNTKDHTLHFGQSSQKETEQEKLEAGKAVYYTWAEPTGSRELCWKCGTYMLSLYGWDFCSSKGLQRVVLFTGEQHIHKMLCESEKAQLAEQEIILSLMSVGISLVNNSTSQEVSFIGITSSDVVWELKPKKKNRWKTLSSKEAEMLEDKFRRYTESTPIDNAIVDLENNFQVSFTPSGTDMRMLQPCDAPLRRNFLPGVKVEYSVSPRQKAYRVQIHRIQIQNQLPGAIFPYVFYPVKLPKSITMDSEPKPLTDISIVTRAAGHSDISRIKYFMVLIQEMDLKLDLGFLYAILDLFTPENASIMSSEQEVELFEKDIEYIKTELNHVSAADTSPISLYEYFHISPIKLHLSFSLSTGGEDGLKQKRDTELIPVQSLNLLLKSIGATLTDVQDVVFKLAFFELTFQFCTTQQLQWEVIRHYSKQAIKQMYVLVLGLDVLGNPFGLIRGLSEGVEAFFYEPYQGAIQGPEEFVEGMALGVKALVGGAVGGIAGAASRITGAMAKGVAAITMDEEYQQKRREAMNKQPSGLREGLTRGGKGLVSGFVSGITGIVTKPIKGAQKEGAAGFFKGVGKGLVGAVARPTGGIIDMASSTFQGIKRAAETSQDVQSLRPPRFIHEDGVIRPYKEREGIGSQMLQKIENGRFAKYRYFAHAKINDSDFLMITKRGIFFVTKGTFGQLTCEWQYLFEEFTKDPMIVEDRRLRIEAKERVKSVFHAKEFGKIINFKTPEIAKWVLAKLEDARESLPKY